ncbi:MAG: DNA-binding domain-containing protein [Alphaproteobacteria bacterium]
MLRELQRDFAAGLFAPGGSPVLERIVADGIAPDRRLFVHFNTVARSLTQVLANAYPALHGLLGPDAFRSAALDHVRARPPAGAALLAYGDGFGAAAAAAAPDLDPQLVEAVAAIEWAQKQAFHAADAPVLTAAALQAVPAAQLPGLVLRPHPALRLCAAPTAGFAVWSRAIQDGPAARRLASTAEGPSHTLIARPESSATVTPVSPGQYALVAALAAGRCLGEAVEEAVAADDGLDLGRALRELPGLAAFSHIHAHPGEQEDGDND